MRHPDGIAAIFTVDDLPHYIQAHGVRLPGTKVVIRAMQYHPRQDVTSDWDAPIRRYCCPALGSGTSPQRSDMNPEPSC